MLRLLLQSVLCLAVLTILTGLVYPLVVTGVAVVAFPHQAHGSLIMRDGHAVGSQLIGQAFSDPRYFWSRPSATSDANSKPLPYNAGSSGGSNLGPINPDLGKQVKERVAALRAADPGNTQPVPVDLVTASASGLDPDISPAAAEFQAPRVARARGLAESAVRDLVRQHTHERFLGVLGEPRVNVLELNLALDGRAR
ncbi:MAG: potassium-transporting ATPase subunit KdpC [Planctomycetota bacterium]|nr:potassium-transporting ATPase subunit KdpC [Planctomycetota bacterium]